MLWLQLYVGASALCIIALAWLIHTAPLFDEYERAMASVPKHAFAGARALGRPISRSPSRPRSFRLTREARSFRLAR